MSTPQTRAILVDQHGRPIPQFWNARLGTFGELVGDDGALNITSMRRKFRDDFPGTSLSAAAWQVVQTGTGHTVTVTASELQVATGTAINTETVIQSVERFTIPFRAMFLFWLSQRIANQEFFLEVVNAAGNMLAQWRYDGVAATTAFINATNANASGTWGSVTIPTTASVAIAEIELFPDETYFHARAADSIAARTISAVRTRLIPDPNESYHLRMRARNLGTAPASSTTLRIDAITVQDIAELTAEITAGRGGTSGAQSIPVTVAGGTLPTVSTVSTVSAVTTVSTVAVGNMQSINTAWADTSTVLGANAVFTGTSRDFTATQRINHFLAASTADQPGTLFVEQSNDGVNWVMTHSAATASVPDADATARHIARIEAAVCNRFARVRYRNGGTAQGAFRLISLQRGI